LKAVPQLGSLLTWLVCISPSFHDNLLGTTASVVEP
jgi:hypothetical protein